MRKVEHKDEYDNMNVFEAAITADNIVEFSLMGSKTGTRNSKTGKSISRGEIVPQAHWSYQIR